MTSPTGPEAQPVGTFWVLELAHPLPAAPRPRLPVAFLRLGPADAAALAQAMRYDDPEPVRQRFAAGKHCYAGQIDNAIATYGWVTFDEESIGELGLRFHLAPGDAYIWDCATLPLYRGQGLYPALLAHIARALHQAGLSRAWVGADADNLPSQSGMARAGFLPVVDILPSPTPPGLCLRGRPGVLEQMVRDMRAALR